MRTKASFKLGIARAIFTQKHLSLLVTAVLFFTNYCFAQLFSDTLHSSSDLEEVVVSGSKFPEKNRKLAMSIRTIKSSEMKRYNLSTTANLLESSGAAFVQRSQQGGGSPVLRGFEASRVLLMLDGVRLNNAIYRAGHLQNIITVDPNILDRIEILYGPSSTLYGSDALGGVVNIFTRQPVLSGKKDSDTTVITTSLRYSAATDEKTGHIDYNYGGYKWASLTSLTYSDFGDVATGKRRNDKYPDFGLVRQYAQRVNGKDSAVQNDKPRTQVPTGYHQVDVLQKVSFTPDIHTSHLLNLQVSHSSNIPRFDRLSEIASGVPRFAEWYYGPQKRYAASYTYQKTNNNRFFNELRAVTSYQYIEESRYDRRFRQQTRNERIEKVKVAGITVDGRKKFDDHELVAGFDGQLNFLTSTARGVNVENGVISPITTRYPDGKNRMYYAAVYAQHLWKISEKLTFNDGLRLNFVHLNSQFNDTLVIKFPFQEAIQTHTAFSGNAGLVYAPNLQFKLALVASTGFRAPNIDDLAKVFDSRAGAVVVPNATLQPEYTYNAEVNFVKYMQVADNPYGARLGGAVYYTWFTNAIVIDQFNFKGQDSILYGGVLSQVLASQNKARAHLWGWSAYSDVYLLAALKLSASIAYTYGQFTNNNNKVPLDHVPPVFGRVGLQHNRKRLGAEVYTQFNGWKKIENYNPNGEDNLQYATPDGMPSWCTINARFNWQLNKNIQAQFAFENATNVHYRTFASGYSSPGVNFIFNLKSTF